MLPRVLCSDPPWKFKDGLPTTNHKRPRGASGHYRTLTVPEIIRYLYNVPIAFDAHLIMWRVSALVEEAYQVVRSLGFEAKSEIVWKKTTPAGGRHFGMGRHVRLEHETAIIATRGRGAPILSHSIRSLFEAPVGRHSEKPEIFYTGIIEKMLAGPYVETFARRRRPGWTSYGDELPRERRPRAR